MISLLYFLVAVLPLLVLVAIVASLTRVRRVQRELRALRERVEQLERLRPAPVDLTAVSPPGAPEAEAPPAPPPLPLPTGRVAQPSGAGDAPAAFPETAPPRPDRDVEQLVGGVWLQNAGSVLVLVGVFFLILWGWTSGRLGPGVLVAAGVGVGLGIAWRGDRMTRTLQGIGHALIGVGCGVMYLSLYLGHFTLHVLPAPLAFALLVAASALTVFAGLRYRVQSIAALGIVGAFLPQWLAAWIPLQGFHLGPAPLLAYLAVVDALVLVLATSVGWSALGLASLLLSAAVWIAMVPATLWSWPLEIGLSAVFVLLGLAPVPRLTRRETTVRPIDLSVVAVAPLVLIACSWPMWALARAPLVAILLGVLAALYLAAAVWVDARRPERDLWRPLTGAATVFLTAALQRAVGTENTPLAWTTEGAVLVLLGLAPRGGWLRFCGHVVGALGGFWLLGKLVAAAWSPAHLLPVWNPDALRDAVAVTALLVAGLRLHAERERLAPGERVLPHVWTGAANLMLLLWTRREAAHLGWTLEGTGGPWRRLPDVQAPPGAVRQSQLTAGVTALAWIAQAAALLAASLRRRWTFLRVCAHVLGGFAALVLFVGMRSPDGWGRDLPPVIHRDGLLFLAGALGIAAVAWWLARCRASLADDERNLPEVWAAGAALLMLTWFANEADHVARAVLDLPGRYSYLWRGAARMDRTRLAALAPTLTSVAWLAQALASLALGWWRRSAFLRWMGLVLVGVTALKILLVDLAGADPFWRFLAAIAAGVAMLAVSYAYQRKRRAEKAEGGGA